MHGCSLDHDKVTSANECFSISEKPVGGIVHGTVKERGLVCSGGCRGYHSLLARLNEEAWIDYLRPRGHSAYLVPNHNTKLIMSELLPRALQLFLLLEHYTCINNYKRLYIVYYCWKYDSEKRLKILENKHLIVFFKRKAKLFHVNTQNISTCEGAL